MIDFCQTFGADINRSENRIQGVKALNFGPLKPGAIPHLNTFFPGEGYSSLNLSLPMTLQLLFKVETNLKLNIFEIESQEKYIKEDWKLKKNEVHFLLMEGLLGRISSQSKNIFSQVGQIRRLLDHDPNR